MATRSILDALHGIEEAPWSDLKGKELTARGLANYVRQYGVVSKQVRIGEVTLKGYAREDLHEPWLRYLEEPAKERETNETNETSFAFKRHDDGGEWKDEHGDALP